MLKKRANTTAFNVRMDVRDFASLVSAYRTHVPPSTAMSTYLRYAAEDFAKLLRESGKAESFDSSEAANDYLCDAGLRQQAKAVRAAASLIQEIAEEKQKITVEDRKRTAPAAPSPDEILSILEKQSGAKDS